jgi:phosphatidylserine/phosphatidylglycerophosphate/cardiolipin synthase-like enzyme
MRRLAAALLLLSACASSAEDGGTTGPGGKADDPSESGSQLPDPNADEAPAADWLPPPVEEWPDAYVVFNNTGCGRSCGKVEQEELKSRSVMIKMIVAAIHEVKEGGTIRVANFNISSSSGVTPVADALLFAMRERGATVKIAMDSEQDLPDSRSSQLARDGADVRFSRGLEFESSVDGSQQFGILHSKMVIVDDQVLFTGSNNFSASGFITNEENSVVLRATAHADRIAAFTCDFEAMFAAGSLPGAGPLADTDPARKAAVASLDSCLTDETWFPPASMLTSGKSVAFGVLVGGIAAAKESIDVAPDMLAHPGLVAALLDRARDAVAAGSPFRVRVALDASPEALANPAFGQCMEDAAAAESLPVEVRYWRGNEEIFQLLHHKMMVIDGDGEEPVLFNGSANYSSKALKFSFENVARYRGDAFAELDRMFADRFERIFAEAQTRDELAADGITIPACPVPGL